MKGQYELIPIEINLLQKREIKSSDNHLLIIIMIVLLLAAASFVGWFWYSTVQQLAETNKQLEQVSNKIAKLEEQLSKNPFRGQISELLKLPETLREFRPQTTKLMDRFAGLFPAYANLSGYELTPEGNIKLIGLFATMEEIITFMQSVEKSPYFESVKLGPIDSIQTQTRELDLNSTDDRELWLKRATFEVKYKEPVKGDKS